MAVSYRNLWRTLNEQNLKKTDLIEMVGLSSSTIAKLSQNRTVTTDVLDRIGLALNCDIEDILEIERDSAPATALSVEEPTHTVVSLFSGCGGLDLGFKGGFSFLGREYPSHPFDIIWANDFN